MTDERYNELRSMRIDPRSTMAALLAEVERLKADAQDKQLREVAVKSEVRQLLEQYQRLREALEFAAALIAKIPYEHVAKAHMTSAIACDQPPETYIRHALEASDG